jgi:hypothetical protein
VGSTKPGLSERSTRARLTMLTKVDGGTTKSARVGAMRPLHRPPKRAHTSSLCRRQPIFSWHLIQEMSRIDASILDSRWPLEIRGGIRGNQRAARWRPHCPASHGRIDNDTRPAFQTKLLSSVTSAGAAVLVEEKLGSRATYREKNSISQNVSET